MAAAFGAAIVAPSHRVYPALGITLILCTILILGILQQGFTLAIAGVLAETAGATAVVLGIATGSIRLERQLKRDR